ncbi:MAG TPA: alkyl sulfatase dimerization domain-containing protein [Candidatus Sulfotelmatobacter sp.]|nr:alkyl sulfatase dimerization domain-containing protein [Candidatus Sulfotelmatobacter sp.]
MPDLLALSARYIDENVHDNPGLSNRVSTQLSEIADNIALVEAFSHVVAFRTGDGLVLFDTSLEAYANGVLTELRRWSKEPVSTVAFTHGHVDHVGGMDAVLQEAAAAGARRPRIVGHENIAPRFKRYKATNGYNAIINMRQFAPSRRISANPTGLATRGRFGPSVYHEPDTTFRDRLEIRVGDTRFDLRHAVGETDDHLWAWIPEHRAICAGDFVIWVFPNAGNPQKVQRYPLEWAQALREMAALEPELLLPAHGLPVGGRERIRGMLDTMASALELLVRQTVDMMNAGARLDDIIHSVTVPAEYLARPYMRPLYDEPEFVIHNVWRLYGGWYDGNPARLKPARDAALAVELANLAGGIAVLTRRAGELADRGDFRLACHLAEIAVQAEPDSRAAHAVRRDVYAARARSEASLMAKGIFGHAARESETKAGEPEKS